LDTRKDARIGETLIIIYTKIGSLFAFEEISKNSKYLMKIKVEEDNSSLHHVKVIEAE
jgi:hypothetical protein